MLGVVIDVLVYRFIMCSPNLALAVHIASTHQPSLQVGRIRLGCIDLTILYFG